MKRKYKRSPDARTPLSSGYHKIASRRLRDRKSSFKHGGPPPYRNSVDPKTGVIRPDPRAHYVCAVYKKPRISSRKLVFGVIDVPRGTYTTKTWGVASKGAR